MTDDRSLERAARSWLDEGPDRAPQAAVDAALSRISTTRQERDRLVPRRISNVSGFTRLLAAAAVGLAVVAGTVVVAPRLQGPNVAAPSANPSATSTSAPSASGGDVALNAYRAARNAICSNGKIEMRKADLVGLYDQNLPAARRATVNGRARQVADVVARVARDLAGLTPPADLAESHAADVAHAQDVAAVFAAEVQFLADGDIEAAGALEHAIDAIRGIRAPFEESNGFDDCP